MLRGPAALRQAARGQQQVLFDAQAEEQVGDLEGASDAAVRTRIRCGPRDVASLQQHLAAGGRRHAGDGVEQRGLPGAVGPQDRHAFAFGHLQAHAIDGLEGAEVDADVLQVEQHVENQIDSFTPAQA